MVTDLAHLQSLLSSNSLLEHKLPNLELKEDWQKNHGRKISGLCNKRLPNAWFVAGVKDDGSLAGRNEKWARQTEEVISQHINEFLDPVFAVKGIYPIQLQDTWVIAVNLEFPEVLVNWEGKPFKASGTTVEEMTSGEALEFTIRFPGKFDLTAKDVEDHHQPDLVLKFSQHLGSMRNESDIKYLASLPPQEVLSRLKIGSKQTARILFGNCKVRTVYMDAEGNVVDNKTLLGGYNLLLADLTTQIQNHAKTYAGIENAFPAKALHEGIANAVAHAAYFERDGEIILEVFPDKICISNLCLNDSEAFANKWFSRSHRTVNNLMMETLRFAKHTDELGRGKGIIFRESLKNGLQPPVVQLETAGRYHRWRLYLYAGSGDAKQRRLLERLLDYYKGDINKSLIAMALIYWEQKSVSTIRPYVDADSEKAFAEVLSDLEGPIFYWKDKDQIVPRRWVRILLREGADSKSFTPAEEIDLRERAYRFQSQFGKGLISSKDLRSLAAMGDTASERTLSSSLLKKWEKAGALKKVRHGLYQFSDAYFNPFNIGGETIAKILERLRANTPQQGS